METTRRVEARPIVSFGELLSLFHSAKRIVVTTGAGISTACGIPDFRSEGSGLYDIIRSIGSELIVEPQEL